MPTNKINDFLNLNAGGHSMPTRSKAVMGLNWEEVPQIKQKKKSTSYRGNKEAAHVTKGGKGKVAQAIAKAKGKSVS